MSADTHDRRLVRDAKRVLTTRLIPQARRWQEIVRRDWASILIATGARMGRDNVSVLAAGVAFHLFVAIPSSLTAIVSIYGLMFNPTQVESQVGSLIGCCRPMSSASLPISSSYWRPSPSRHWGVRLVTAVWIGSSALFALYVSKVATYDVSYGPLGAVVVLLLWLYIAAYRGFRCLAGSGTQRRARSADGGRAGSRATGLRH